MEKKLINLYPAANWFDTTPVGNGRIGASVYGCVYDERILINHEALFNYARTTELPDVSGCLKEVRELMDNKRYLEAESYYTNALRNAGYSASKGKFYPAFDIRMIFGTLGAPYEYSRELDMENGVCTVSYKENGEAVTRRIFASHTDKFVVIDIQKPSPFNMIFALERHDLADWVDYRNCDKFESFSRDGYVYSHCETEGRLNYSGIIKVHYTDGTMTHIEKAKKRKIDMEGALVLDNSIKIEGATRVTLVFNIENKAKEFDKMRAGVDKFTLPFDTALSRHTRKFRSLFNRAKLSLCGNARNKSSESLLLEGYEGNVGNMLTEKMADYGRYLLISSSTGCQCPANLQGVWNGAYSPAWACTYFNNENIQIDEKPNMITNENAYVKILDDPDTIMRKFKRAVTDSEAKVYFGDSIEKAGINNLMTIYSAVTGASFDKIESDFDGKGYGDFKVAVAEAVIEELRPVRERFNELMSDKAQLEAMYKRGAEEASYIARKTLSKVKRKVGFVK